MARIVNGDEYLQLPRPLQTWLVEPILPVSGALLLFGDPKVGKSFAALQLAEAICNEHREDWFGFPVRQRGKVVYIQLDTPRSLWADRIENVRTYGLRTGCIHFADKETLECYPFDILNPAHYTLLFQSLKEINPVCVIFDTYKESSTADENQSDTAQRVVSALVNVAYPAAIVVVAHSRKPSGDYTPDLINDSRGSSYLPGRVDAVVRFTEKTLYFTGRALEKGSIKMARHECGIWVRDESRDRLNDHIQDVIRDPSLKSTLQKATELSTRTGRSLEACRSLVRRASII